MTQIAGTGSSNRIFKGQKKDFIVMRKDTFNYTGTYTYVDEDDTTLEYDFTNCVGAMAIKKKKTDTTAVRIVSVSFDAEEYTLFVDADDMDMDAGKYYYDLQIYDANSKMVTKLYGDFIVLQDITDMAYPEDEEIYLNIEEIIDFEKQLAIKNELLLSNNIGFVIGTVVKPTGIISSQVNYIVHPSYSSTTVISSSVAYQLMTQWFKHNTTITSEISYLETLFLSFTGSINSTVTWTIFSVGTP